MLLYSSCVCLLVVPTISVQLQGAVSVLRTPRIHLFYLYKLLCIARGFRQAPRDDRPQPNTISLEINGRDKDTSTTLSIELISTNAVHPNLPNNSSTGSFDNLDRSELSGDAANVSVVNSLHLRGCCFIAKVSQ